MFRWPFQKKKGEDSALPTVATMDPEEQTNSETEGLWRDPNASQLVTMRSQGPQVTLAGETPSLPEEDLSVVRPKVEKVKPPQLPQEVTVVIPASKAPIPVVQEHSLSPEESSFLGQMIFSNHELLTTVGQPSFLFVTTLADQLKARYENQREQQAQENLNTDPTLAEPILEEPSAAMVLETQIEEDSSMRSPYEQREDALDVLYEHGSSQWEWAPYGASDYAPTELPCEAEPILIHEPVDEPVAPREVEPMPTLVNEPASKQVPEFDLILSPPKKTIRLKGPEDEATALLQELKDFENECIQNKAEFMKRSINSLVDAYFANGGIDGTNNQNA